LTTQLQLRNSKSISKNSWRPPPETMLPNRLMTQPDDTNHNLHRDERWALIPRWWRIVCPIFHDAPPDLIDLPITWAEHATWRLGNANPASNSTMNDEPHAESTRQ
jgi:hypothetical protein